MVLVVVIYLYFVSLSVFNNNLIIEYGRVSGSSSTITLPMTYSTCYSVLYNAVMSASGGQAANFNWINGIFPRSKTLTTFQRGSFNGSWYDANYITIGY